MKGRATEPPGSKPHGKTSRRKFIQASSLFVASGAVGGGLQLARAAHPSGSDVIRIGLVGCGRRGTGAALQALNTTGGPVRLVALADVFPDKMQGAYRALKGIHADKVDVPRNRRFAGLEGYRHLLETDVDLVVLATPPGFRPLHFDAVVQAGKHAFLEKPLAVDPAGLRLVAQANERARQQGLAVAVGLQRRHETPYRETVARLQDGAVGRIVLARAYWNGNPVPRDARAAKHSELEYQLRNWSGFNWLGGDPLIERHIHNLDVINWLLDGVPTSANGQGARATATADSGQTFDQHFVEFTYPGEVRLFGQCRRRGSCWNRISEHVHGTDGYADVSGAKIYTRDGRLVWQGAGKHDGHQQEQHDLFAALRRSEAPNECLAGLQSTMTAVLGYLASSSGQLVHWDDAVKWPAPAIDVAQLRSLADAPPVRPALDGSYPVNRPGASLPV